MAQVPNVKTEKDVHEVVRAVWGLPGRYGADCRKLFVAEEGMVLVGADLSGIEARLLAHFLYPYDGGAYVDQVLNGDIHQMNADAIKKFAGLDISRNDTKTGFYAKLYSAGHAKLGYWAVESCPQAKEEFKSALVWNRRQHDEQTASFLAYRSIGRRINDALERGIRGFDRLSQQLQREAVGGSIIGFDGRKLPVRKAHAVLNTCLQANAAIIAKNWVVGTYRAVRKARIRAHLHCFVHDEIQQSVLPADVDRFGEVTLGQIKGAGRRFSLNIPLDGEIKTGANWQQTH